MNQYEAEAARLLEEQKKAFEERGLEFKPWYNMQKGENTFEIVAAEEIREINGKYGPRKVFRVKVAGEEKDLGISEKNPLYKDLVMRVAKGQTKFTVVKTGEGKETRYEIIEKK